MKAARIALKLRVKKSKDSIVVSWNDIVRRTEREAGYWLLLIGAISAVLLMWIFIEMWQEGVDHRKIAYASGERKRRLLAQEDAAFAGNMLRILLFPIIWGIILFASNWFLRMRRAKSKRVTISKDKILIEGQSYPLSAISRIAYASRGDWDSSDQEKNNLSQIRVWFQDDYFSIVVAENNWVQEYNHEIQQSLERAILEMRRLNDEDDRARARTAEASGQSGFGIPIYQ